MKKNTRDWWNEGDLSRNRGKKSLRHSELNLKWRDWVSDQ